MYHFIKKTFKDHFSLSTEHILVFIQADMSTPVLWPSQSEPFLFFWHFSSSPAFESNGSSLDVPCT